MRFSELSFTYSHPFLDKWCVRVFDVSNQMTKQQTKLNNNEEKPKEKYNFCLLWMVREGVSKLLIYKVNMESLIWSSMAFN